MVVFSSYGTYSPGVAYNTARYVVFKVAIEGLMFTIFNFEVGKVASAVLGCQWPLLHIEVSLLFLFLGI